MTRFSANDLTGMNPEALLAALEPNLADTFCPKRRRELAANILATMNLDERVVERAHSVLQVSRPDQSASHDYRQ